MDQYNLSVEISVFDDYSEDNSLEKLYDWQQKFAKDNDVTMHITCNKTGHFKGGKLFNDNSLKISKNISILYFVYSFL